MFHGTSLAGSQRPDRLSAQLPTRVLIPIEGRYWIGCE